MFEQIINHGVLFYVIAGICGIGVVSSLLVNFLYGRLVKDANNMVSPKTKVMKQLKQKFENSYKLNENINNVPVFINKWIQSYKVMGVSVHKLNRTSIYMMAISLLLSGTGLYFARDFGNTLQVQINYIAAGCASLLLLVAGRGFGDFTYKRELIFTNVRDYLENSLMNRLQYDNRNSVKERRVKERKLEGQAVEAERIQTPVPEIVAPPASAVGDSARANSDIIHFEENKNRSLTGKVNKVNSKGSKAAEKSNERKLQDNIDRMKQSMSEIAASSSQQNPSNKEILQSMDPRRQEEVIREILKEFLS